METKVLLVDKLTKVITNIIVIDEEKQGTQAGYYPPAELEIEAYNQQEIGEVYDPKYAPPTLEV